MKCYLIIMYIFISYAMSFPTELVIKQVKYCQIKTKSGNRCCNKIAFNQNYCTRHITLFKHPKPEECIICCDSLQNTDRPLSCGHWIHKKCILKWKDECPICRRKLILTRKERSILAKNKQTTSTDNDLDYQAIASIIRQDIEERGMRIDNIEIQELTIENVDFLSSLVIRQAIESITNAMALNPIQLIELIEQVSLT